jgi:hypothetical protein
LLGIIFALFVSLFIEPTGLYSGGTTAFFQGIARFIRVIIYEKTHLSENEGKLIYSIMF